MSGNVMINIEDLHKKFGDTEVIKGISLSICLLYTSLIPCGCFGEDVF